MKKNLFIATAIALFCSLFFSVQSAKASNMYDLVKYGQEIVTLLESRDQEIVRAEYDLIHEGSPKVIYRTLSSDYTYNIVGFSQSERVSDLDIVVYKKVNGEWVEVDKDTETDATPIVSVTPSYTREYKIVLRVYSWKNDYSVACYGLIVSHD